MNDKNRIELDEMVVRAFLAEKYHTSYDDVKLIIEPEWVTNASGTSRVMSGSFNIKYIVYGHEVID